MSKRVRFTDYTNGGFSFEDQERQAGVNRRLSKNGVWLMLGNSCRDEINDLYDGFSITIVLAWRFINGTGDKRSGASEQIITDY